MGRGIGTRQRIVLAALKRLERERGPGWRSPAEVIATVTAMTRPAPAEPFDPYAHTDGPRLEHLRGLVAQGYREFQRTALVIEARIAARAARQEAKAEAARRKAARRYPNQVRPEPRGGEDGNPSRVLAALERRGLVERQARRGPGAMVRLVPVAAR